MRAGFVYTETTRYPTAAKCVFWFKELIFEKEDNPWEEHRSYAKNCGFVEFNKPDDNEWTRDTILKLAEDFRKASKETEKRT
ncbi:hypothetical protein KIN20_025275 [Parelaphostrongylus tenuis]|uniref:Uncharacterized protein n=1 Tax=Parelaphostrongylus tenuis TaxID=148309 RepID=A0AAD5NAN1_PARTN|nr:hypothetical protein KIN20_025275 [Parelaphostrongylus tenuis]